ncbi:MAG TPA: alpha-L-arabinofuranosidase [Verrucomicrobiae bacterium]|nr:alpha-L-arabinofuranosidase [Verrucomicrobiae bacterium]
MKRRSFLRTALAGAALAAAHKRAALAQSESGNVVVDPKPLFKISPRLFMQFMEPLGVTDSSVEAAWSYDTDDWWPDFIEVTKGLAPGVVRWGGLLSRYYKWREGIGPADKRPWYRNYVWGGKETHRVGTHEFVDFCRRVGAEALYCVNFESDGFVHFAQKPEGNRSADAKEAADWVSYCNDPENAERKANGSAAPLNVKLWQLGNETSYGRGGFAKDVSIAKTIEFAKAMRARDKSIDLIGWGDDGWAGDLAERAGEHINAVAIHMMQQTPMRKESLLQGLGWQEAPERAWEELMELVHERVEKKLLAVEQQLDERGSKLPIAITEGHLSLQPHNSNPILTEWLTGVYHARVMNLYLRHAGRVQISTLGDFNGNRWTSNTVIHQTPGSVSYLLPAGAVMRLFGRHHGTEGVAVKKAPSGLDIAASRSGNRVFLNVANMDFSRSVEASFAVDGTTVKGGKVFAIAPERVRQEISSRNPTVFDAKEEAIPAGEVLKWRFPARSVSAVELECVAG